MQALLDLILNPNVLYLVLVAAVWAAALALVFPGTGVVELAAAVLLGLAGLGLVRLQISPWGALCMLLGLGLFAVEFRRPSRGLFLAASGVALAAGSMLIFRGPEGTRVSPWLAVTTTLVTLAYFWIGLRKAVTAQQKPPLTGLQSLEGMRGEARTQISPEGTVYVGGELWSAESDQPIGPGEAVVVVERQGLKLKVARADGAGR